MRIRPHGPARTAAVSVALALALALTLACTACGQTGRKVGPAHSAPANGGFMIGVLMPDNNATRYRAFDTPLIEQRIKQLCAACTVVSANAQGDASTQRQQMNTMLTNGAAVLVLDCVDVKSCRALVQQSRNAGVPVVAYDRLGGGPVSGFVSYDDYAIGRLQGQGLLQGMGRKAHGGLVEWLDVPLVKASATLRDRRTGAMSVLRGRVRFDTAHVITDPTISQQAAYAAMAAAIASLGPHAIDGVFTVNDTVAAGAIAALRAARVSPLPPVVGQDAELSAIQRVVAGEQYMTVYKPYGPEADTAAEMAVALGRGRGLDGIARTTVSNSTTRGIPAVLLSPVPVTAGSVKATVIRGGTYTIKQVCTPELLAACRKAGLL